LSGNSKINSNFIWVLQGGGLDAKKCVNEKPWGDGMRLMGIAMCGVWCVMRQV